MKTKWPQPGNRFVSFVRACGRAARARDQLRLPRGFCRMMVGPPAGHGGPFHCWRSKMFKTTIKHMVSRFPGFSEHVRRRRRTFVKYEAFRSENSVFARFGCSVGGGSKPQPNRSCGVKAVPKTHRFWICFF